MTRPNIIQFLENEAFFGRTFHDPSWANWKRILRATYGLPLDAAGRAWICQHAGLSKYSPPPGGPKEVAVITGRQSGKTIIASRVIGYEAAFPLMRPGVGEYYALMVSQDQRSSLRTLMSYAKAPFETSPVLKGSVLNATADALSLNTGVTIAAYPCRPAAIRGLRSVINIADELAFFLSTEGNPVDLEMLRAMRPGLATTGGKLIILSSPYAESGALYELHRKHFGKDDSSVLVIQATAPELNPTLPADYLARMEADDPEAYRSEVLGEFRKGISTLLDPDALMACVDMVTRERLPEAGVTYIAFVDAATGGGRDKFTVAIAHVQKIGGREIIVLDCIRAWAPPFDPNQAISEASALFKRYKIKQVVGDSYAGGSAATGEAGGFVESGFRAHGIRYTISEWNRSELYLELLPLINSNTVQLLNVPEMLKEFRMLERRRANSGRDIVNHRPGGHDDLANSAAGVLVHVAAARRKGGPFSRVGSWTKSTDGSVYIDGQQVHAPERSQSRENAPWVHPHERIEPVGPSEMSERKRRAWGGV